MRGYLVALVLLALSGCTSPDDRYPPYFAVDDVKQLELFYLDPFARYDPESAPKYEGEFRGWPVIGKTTVNDRRSQREIAVALTRGLDEGDREEMASCFDPHHGLRIETAGGVIEVEICYSCGQAIFVGGPRPGHHAFSGSSHEVLDRILTKAKVLPLEN